MSTIVRFIARCIVPLAVMATATLAQGRLDFANFEYLGTHPIEAFELDGRGWIAVCNTADDSVELYSTDETVPWSARFVQRVRVGLRPVSVRFDAEDARLYTANALGDSVSLVALSTNASGDLTARVKLTRNVGDEPMDIALGPSVLSGDALSDPGGGLSGSGASLTPQRTLYVTLRSAGRLAWLHAKSLTPVLAGSEAGLALTEADLVGLNEPRSVVFRDGRVFVLGMKGGIDTTPCQDADGCAEPVDPPHGVYDRDVYIGTHEAELVGWIDELGSTNFAMAAASNGDLWVVGGEAQFHLMCEESVAAAATGFVKSTVYRVTGALAGLPSVARRDLNAAAVIPGDVPCNDVLAPVAFADALAMPTDLALVETAGAVTKVFVACFGSDRLGVLEPGTGGDAQSWPLRRIDVPVKAGSASLASGPRGLAYKPALAGDPDDPGERLYVLAALDASISIVDPVAEVVVETVPLRQDPTPVSVRDGRPFLYSAAFSGNGFTSCASCHVDGRTDSLAWSLGSMDGWIPLDTSLASGFPMPCGPLQLQAWLCMTTAPGGPTYPVKGPMVTQTLQGLLNHPVPSGLAPYFSNRPYHWRGDKADLVDFQGAFESLMGGPGISDAQMDALVAFVNTIRFPPNPEQPLDRGFSGDFGDVALADDPTEGSGAQHGLKLFHIMPLAECLGMSCVQCHALPEGSDGDLTELRPGALVMPCALFLSLQPIETQGLRGLAQRAARRLLDDGSFFGALISAFGLNHDGDSESVFDFLATNFENSFASQEPQFLADVERFVREFDSGTAPAVGLSVTVTDALAGSAAVADALDLMEAQAGRANVGVAVSAYLAGVERGFWLDPRHWAMRYREEPAGPVLSRAQLLALLQSKQDRLHVLATPLGGERRAASPSGVAAPLPGAAPVGLTLETMTACDPYADVPHLTKNWAVIDPEHPDDTFKWGGEACKDLSGNPDPTPTPTLPKLLRILQYALLTDAPDGFGLDRLRHDAPRRLEVAGRHIRHGASLRLSSPAAGPPDTTQPPVAASVLEIVLPLHATSRSTADGRAIWTTEAAFSPDVYYALMLGGFGDPAVAQAIADPIAIAEPTPAGMFSPVEGNWHHLVVENADGTSAAGGWQRLLLD